MRITFLSFLLLFSSFLFGIDQFASIPAQEYYEAKITLNIPQDLIPAEIVEQYDTTYDFGLKYPGIDGYEVRVGLYPKDYLGGIEQLVDKEEIKKHLFMMTLITGYNIAQSDKNPPNIVFFPEDAVQTEFNADLGTSNIVIGNSMFSDKYKIVMIISLYKKNHRYLVIYHLFKDLTLYKKMWESGLILKTFHIAQFRD